MGRPIVVTVGPLASADADGVTLSQKAAGAEYLAINGALTNGGTANNVCQSQTPAGAGNLTLNGTLCSSVPTGSAVAYLGSMQRVYFTCAANESGVTFTISGYGYGPSGGPFAITETLTGSNASIVASQNTYYAINSIAISGAATGAITVGRAGVATLDAARQVRITSAGNDSGITFAIVGTDINGTAISETLTGANASTADSALSYKTVTSIKSSGAVATTLTIGTNGVASSQWVRFDDVGSASQVAIQCTVSGTVNYTVQQTMDDPEWLYSGIARSQVTWVNSQDSSVVGATSTAQSNYSFAPVFARVIMNSGTGTVTATFRQAYQD